MHASLLSHFGAAIEADDGEIDRRALGGIVFGNEGKMEELEGIVWPVVEGRVECEIEGSGSEIVLLEAAVLGRAKWDVKFCDEVWRVEVDEETAMRRVVERDNCTEEIARGKVVAQRGKVEGGDIVLNNVGDVKEMTRRGKEEMERARREYGIG